MHLRPPMSLLPVNGLEVIRGASRTLKLNIRSKWCPEDITGGKLYFTLKRSVDDYRPVFTKTSSDPTQILITDAIAGEAEIYLEPSDTQFLDIGEYVYDVWLIMVSAKRYPIVTPAPFFIQDTVSFIP